MTRVRLLPLALLVTGVGLLGCSKGNPHAPARVSGSLTYNGKPIKGGSMAFVTPDGVSYAAQISKDGTYTATDLPTGELVVTVETESIVSKKAATGKDAERRMKVAMQQKPGGAGGGGSETPPEELYVKIPSKYSNAKTSPLSVTLKAGRQVHNIELTD